jgi:Lon protease-like protein
LHDLPLFPLNAVLFPGGRLPLRIFETRYMDMAKGCLRDGTPFGVCAIREGKEVGAPATPHAVGTLARIAEWDMPQLGMLHIVSHGGQRFRILERRVEKSGLQRARIALIDEDEDGSVPAHCAICVRLLERLLDEHAVLFPPPHQLESAAWVGARLAELLPFALPVKQELLELTDAVARLERLTALLGAPDAT